MRIELLSVESKLCTIRAHFGVGSGVEYKSRVWSDGLAHLVEHMVYRQNEHLHDRLGLIGASWNGMTYYNDVTFIATAPSENIYILIDIFAELLLNNKFTQDRLDKERLVILEEESLIRHDLSRNIAIARDRFMCKGYVTKRIGGSSESISKITLEEVQNFYDKHFTTDNLLLTITGKDIEVDRENHYIRNRFGTESRVFNQYVNPPNAYKSKRKQTKYFSQLQGNSRIFIAYRCEPSWSEENVILNLISSFFCSGMDTRLFKELRSEQGLVYSVNGGPSLLPDIGWYNIIAITQKANVKAVIKTINSEVTKLRSEDITDEELTKAKNKELSYIYSLMETSYGMNSLLTSHVVNGTPNLVELERIVRKISKEDIVQTIQNVFREDNQRIFVANPKGK